MDKLRAQILEALIEEMRKALEAGNLEVIAEPRYGKVTIYGIDQEVANLARGLPRVKA
jgi:hypothetical protein